MQLEVREVVASYVLDVAGYKVFARITKGVDESEGFLWDISHYQGGAFKRVAKPPKTVVGSRKEALAQIIEYAQGFDPSSSPSPNNSY